MIECLARSARTHGVGDRREKILVKGGYKETKVQGKMKVFEQIIKTGGTRLNAKWEGFFLPSPEH